MGMFKSIKKSTHKATKSVKKGTNKAAKSAKKHTEKATKSAGKGAKDAGKQVKKGANKATKATTKQTKKAGKAISKAGKKAGAIGEITCSEIDDMAKQSAKAITQASKAVEKCAGKAAKRIDKTAKGAQKQMAKVAREAGDDLTQVAESSAHFAKKIYDEAIEDLQELLLKGYLRTLIKREYDRCRGDIQYALNNMPSEFFTGLEIGGSKSKGTGKKKQEKSSTSRSECESALKPVSFSVASISSTSDSEGQENQGSQDEGKRLSNGYFKSFTIGMYGVSGSSSYIIGADGIFGGTLGTRKHNDDPRKGYFDGCFTASWPIAPAVSFIPISVGFWRARTTGIFGPYFGGSIALVFKTHGYRAFDVSVGFYWSIATKPKFQGFELAISLEPEENPKTLEFKFEIGSVFKL